MKTEDVGVVGTVDEVDQVFADVVGEFFEKSFCLFFCEGTHCALEPEAIAMGYGDFQVWCSCAVRVGPAR